MYISNISNKKFVLPQTDWPHATMNGLSFVEIILFIALN